MSTITLENAPKTYKLDYSDYILVKKNDIWWAIKEFKKVFYNEKKETYWPFEDEEAINFLKMLDYEDRVS